MAKFIIYKKVCGAQGGIVWTKAGEYHSSGTGRDFPELVRAAAEEGSIEAVDAPVAEYLIQSLDLHQVTLRKTSYTAEYSPYE